MRYLLSLFICAAAIAADLGNPSSLAILMAPSGGGGGVISFSGVGFTNLTTSASTYSCAVSNTPSANALVLVQVTSTSGGGQELPALTGFGMSWAMVTNVVASGGGRILSLWRGLTNDAPTADPLVADYAGIAQTGFLLRCVQFEGVDTSGTDGSGAIVQWVSDAQAATENPSLTLNALAGASSAVFGAFGNNADPFGGTAETDWSTDFDSGYTSPVTGGHATYRLATTDNTVVVTAASSTWEGIAIEVKAAP